MNVYPKSLTFLCKCPLSTLTSDGMMIYITHRCFASIASICTAIHTGTLLHLFAASKLHLYPCTSGQHICAMYITEVSAEAQHHHKNQTLPSHQAALYCGVHHQPERSKHNSELQCQVMD